MNNTIQLYADKAKKIKAYPITSPDRVVDENGVSIKKQLRNNVKFDVVSEGDAVPEIDGQYDDTELREKIRKINIEISDARHGEENLGNAIRNINEQLDTKANKSEIGSPLTANGVVEMVDKTKVYVNTTDGNWYSWNGNEWVRGGIYNSQGIADGSISPDKTDFVKSSYQFLNLLNVIENKYYWESSSTVNMADNNGYKVFKKINLKRGKYYFAHAIPVFSFIKNISNGSVVKLSDIIANENDRFFYIDYDAEFYATVSIDTSEAMLTNAPLPTKYQVGPYDIIIDGIELRELDKEVYNHKNEINELKNREELKENSIETAFIKDNQVTIEKTDFIKSSGNYQFLQQDNFEQGKYYWLNDSNVSIANHQEYKIYPKLILKAGEYYFTSFVNVFSFVKNLQNENVSSINDVLNDGKIVLNCDSEIYLTYSIEDAKSMLTDGALPNQYVEGTYNVNTVICECNLTEMNNNIKNIKNEINSLKNEKVTTEKTDFITTGGSNFQFVQKDNFEQGKYYWIDGLNVKIASHSEYKIYPKLTLKAGVYYFTTLVNVFSFVKNIKTGHVIQLNDIINNNKIIVDYDCELYLTYSATDENSMVTNALLPNQYIEGSYGTNDTTICGYNLTEMKSDIDKLKNNNSSNNNSNNIVTGRIFKCGKGEQFTRIKDAIEEASKYPNSTLYVAPETFDLVEEYGQDYLDSYDGREFGMHPHNGLKIIFDSGAKIVFDYRGNNQKVHEFFAPINAQYDGGGYELINVWIESKNCRYSVHDEHAGDTKPYRNIYRHCTFIHDSSNCSWGAHQAIGGGLGTSGDILVEDCLGIAVGTDEVFSWHNAVTDRPCKSNIVVKGCYLEGSLGFGLQGSYSDVTNVFVSNCSLTRKPEVGGAEGSVKNMKLYEWNNEIRHQ